MIIRTDRLTLRPVTLDDAHALSHIWDQRDVRRFLWDDQHVTTDMAKAVIERSQNVFQQRHFGLWAFLLDEKLVGCGGLMPYIEPPDIELIYSVAHAHWGQGIAPEACHAVLRYGFDSCGLKRVIAVADEDNTASWRVMKKLGMTFEKQTIFWGKPLIRYAITRAEFQTKHDAQP